MWPSGRVDINDVGLVLDHQPMLEPPVQFQPTPYTFSKLENGRKKPTDGTCVTPPSWLLLDHTIAVVWSIFNSDPTLPSLSIDDLKWAYEFLKSIKNTKGENPPDVKVCLKEIQDRLINRYAKLTSLKSEDLENLDKAFGEKVVEDPTSRFINSSCFGQAPDSKLSDQLSISSSIKNQTPLSSNRSSRDVIKAVLKEAKEEMTYLSTAEAGRWTFSQASEMSLRVEVVPPAKEQLKGAKRHLELQRTSSEDFPILGEDSDFCEEEGMGEDEEVEKYVLSLFEHEKKEEALQAKTSAKSLIPMPKRMLPTSPKIVTSKDTTYSVTKKEKKTSKKVHCFTQMRSLQVQKSMKVKNTNGEQAAYSKLKAEILTINPNTSKEGVMKFVKEWRSEKVNGVQTEHKKLSSIEEYMKSLNQELKPSFQINSELGLRDNCKASQTRRVLPEKGLKSPSRFKN